MRNIPENNLAYSILLKFDTGSSGSSFLLRTDEKVFLITAKHVLFDPKSNLKRGKKIELICQTEDINNEDVVQLSVDLEKIDILKHPTADIGAIELASLKEKKQQGIYDIEYCEGVSLLNKVEPNLVTVSAEDSTKLLKDVLISNDVFLYGYPTSLGLEDSPQFDYSKPLLRKGIVANIYKDFGTIILDCPVYYGNSGGPVVEVEYDGTLFHHKIIGVVVQFIPFKEEWMNTKSNVIQHTEFTNSGYSVAVAMDKVFELINYKKHVQNI